MREALRVLACAATLVVVTSANAAVLDNFDSYADQAAFNLAWTGTAQMTLATDKSLSSPNSIYQGTIAQQSYRLLDQHYATTSINFEFDFYDDKGTASLARTYGMVYSRATDTWAGALNQILAIGKYNGTATSKYSARIAFGGINWFTLDGAADRSVGWHHAQILGKADGTVDFYIDGVLGANKPCANVDFNYLVMGSGSTSSHGMWFDNVSVTPEPTSLVLLSLGGLLLRRRRA